MQSRKLYEYLNPTTANMQIMESQDGKDLFMQGLFIQGDVKNQNGRVYPMEEIKRAVESVRTRLGEGETVMGELDHPDSSVVNLQNVSHNVLEMHWRGNDLLGTVEVLSTPAGNILKELFKSGIKLGISSRGLGSIKQESSGDEVQKDFELIAFDFVSNPSTHGAFLSPVNESKGSIVSENKWGPVEVSIRNILMGN